MAPGAPPSLTRYAWLSIATAAATLALKGGAAALTGSVGLLSDALESTVNLVAALVAMAALRAASKPPDRAHEFGHGKAEYLSAGVEGTLIVIAAATIAWTAVDRLLHPSGVEDLGVGLAISVVAAGLNAGTAVILLRAGRANRSITLQADARHILTDVWTTAGVLVGVGLVGLTGWEVLDPLVALAVAANIVVAGTGMVRRSVHGLDDASLPAEDLAVLDAVLADLAGEEGVTFHAVRTRAAGRQRFVSLHVLVPGSWTVQQGHDLCGRVEAGLSAALDELWIDTHLEPLEDPASWDDPDGSSVAPPPGPERG